MMNCKKCKEQMKYISTKLSYSDEGMSCGEKLYKCSFCGHKETQYKFSSPRTDFRSSSQPDG